MMTFVLAAAVLIGAACAAAALDGITDNGPRGLVAMYVLAAGPYATEFAVPVDSAASAVDPVIVMRYKHGNEPYYIARVANFCVYSYSIFEINYLYIRNVFPSLMWYTICILVEHQGCVRSVDPYCIRARVGNTASHANAPSTPNPNTEGTSSSAVKKGGAGGGIGGDSSGEGVNGSSAVQHPQTSTGATNGSAPQP